MICPECSKEMVKFDERFYKCRGCFTIIEQTSFDYELMEDDYKKAKENGLKRETVRHRVKYHGWSVERAVSEPVTQKRVITDKQREKINELGLKYTTVYDRMKKQGLTFEQAISFKDRRNVAKVRFTDEELEVARKNGVTRKNANQRVKKCGWTKEQAIHTPVMSKSESGKIRMGMEKIEFSRKK